MQRGDVSRYGIIDPVRAEGRLFEIGDLVEKPAVADARARAERAANSLGVEVGRLVQVMDNGYYGTGSESCGSPANPSYGPYGPGIDPPFDPTVPVAATVTVQVTLTFEMVGKGAATPVSS